MKLESDAVVLVKWKEKIIPVLEKWIKTGDKKESL